MFLTSVMTCPLFSAAVSGLHEMCLLNVSVYEDMGHTQTVHTEGHAQKEHEVADASTHTHIHLHRPAHPNLSA